MFSTEKVKVNTVRSNLKHVRVYKSYSLIFVNHAGWMVLGQVKAVCDILYLD